MLKPCIVLMSMGSFTKYYSGVPIIVKSAVALYLLFANNKIKTHDPVSLLLQHFNLKTVLFCRVSKYMKVCSVILFNWVFCFIYLTHLAVQHKNTQPWC